MLDLDLKHLIEQHPEVLTDHTKLKAYILDLYPNCKRGMVNILVAIQQCGIVAEMQASKNSSALEMSRWKKCLEDDVGFTGALAETCLQMWCSAIGIQEKEKAKSTAISISPELQNSQTDWFEYDGTTLLRLKEEYQEYDGAIYIPYGVESIDYEAFLNCGGLTSIAIPDSVESIGDFAFFGCDGLTSVAIPDSVESIGEAAFEVCYSLTSITIPNSVTSIGKEAFSNCYNLANITIPDSVESIGEAAFEECRSLTSITIPNSVESIGDSAFFGCTGLTSLTIPKSVTSIGESAFGYCSGLTSIKVDSGNVIYHSQGNCVIETANKVLLLGCKTSVIPDDGSATSIGDYAFAGCTDLANITIPESVESIGKEAFSDCSNLESIIIPDSVTRTEQYTFNECQSLEKIIFQGKKAQWEAIEKGTAWDDGTGSYTVHCTDGDISKNES